MRPYSGLADVIAFMSIEHDLNRAIRPPELRKLIRNGLTENVDGNFAMYALVQRDAGRLARVHGTVHFGRHVDRHLNGR